MKPKEQTIINGISDMIASSLTTYNSYFRGEVYDPDQDTIDSRIKELKDRVQRLREIRQQLEDLFAGV